MLTHEERVESGKAHLLVRPDVAGDEQVRGVAARVRESFLVERQKIAVAHPELARAIVGAKRVRTRVVRSIDVRSIDPMCNLVDLLTRVDLTRGRVVDGTVERDDLRTGRIRIEERVAGGNQDGLRFRRVGGVGQIDVVIEELPPLPQEVAGAIAIRYRLDLRHDGIADLACRRAPSAGHLEGAIGVVARAPTRELRLGRTELRVALVVVGTIDVSELRSTPPRLAIASSPTARLINASDDREIVASTLVAKRLTGIAHAPRRGGGAVLVAGGNGQ